MLRAVQGCTAIFNSCKLLKMGVFRKPRFSKGDVENAIDGFFNRLIGVDVSCKLANEVGSGTLRICPTKNG